MLITTTQIVQLCSKLAALSSNQANLSTSDFLSFANLSLMALTSEMLAAREEYNIFSDSLAVTSGVASYRIPYRAVNGDVRHLWFEDGTGSRFRLWPKAIESMEDYSTTTTGIPDSFYVMGNNIVLLPTPNLNGSLVVAYPFRPNQLVDATTTQSITAVNGATVTVNTIPSNFVSGALFDVVDHQSGNGIIAYDQVGTISGNNITFPNPVAAAIGNYVAQANQSPVPMLVEEGHPLLLELTVMRIEMARGNALRIKNSAAQVQDARKAWDALLNNRIVSKAHPAGGGNPCLPSGSRPW